MPVRPLGALVNDRQASIVVSHSAAAPVIPVTMKIKGVAGTPQSDWSFEVAHEKFMTPTFMSVALGSALQAVANERQDVTWNATSHLKVRGHREIVIEDYGVAVGGTPDPQDFVQSNLVRSVGALLNNPWEPVVIESARMEIELRYAREVLRLRGAELVDQEVPAGGFARLRLTLVPFAGPTLTRTVKVPMPKHLAGQTVTLTIQPGYAVEREQPESENVADLIASFQNPIYPPKSVVVSYSEGGGLAFKGNVAKNLPPGALDALRPMSATVAPVTFKSEVRHVAMLSEFMTGQDSATVKVNPVLR
jgi:hypothetical protein